VPACGGGTATCCRELANPNAGANPVIAQDESVFLSLTGQAVHDIRRQLASSIFKIPIERICVVIPDVGGGFGMKNYRFPEWVLVLWAARKLGRPVGQVSERAEDFVALRTAGIFCSLKVCTRQGWSSGVYNIRRGVRGAFTNKPPIEAYRGAGKPEANYLIERLLT
jgi:carbon-monoxide dehydrogenase large subunit